MWISVMLMGLNSRSDIDMFISVNRFLDQDRNTVLLVDYQIPYRNICFIAKQSAFYAEVAIRLEVVCRDSIVTKHEYTDSIGLSNKNDITSQFKSHLNRIRLLLDRDDYVLRFTAIDLNTERSHRRVIPLRRLDRESLVSDVELVSVLRKESTRYLEKFHRGGVLFQVEPSQIFAKDLADDLYLYFEIYETKNPGEDLHNIDLEISKQDSVVVSKNFDYLLDRSNEGISLTIPIDDLRSGIYHGELTVTFDNLSEKRNFRFSISENREAFIFMFSDLEQEYQLIRYFISSGQISDWRSMTENAKRRFISQFWNSMASATNQSIDQTITMVKERIEYSNRFFSHFSPGWTTDMGRIYIRNGAPDEIEKGQTSDETRFVRKDIQIWKYTLRKRAVYLFADLQMNGNFKLLFVENDEMELSHPEWKRFLGDDFDEARLRY